MSAASGSAQPTKPQAGAGTGRPGADAGAGEEEPDDCGGGEDCAGGEVCGGGEDCCGEDCGGEDVEDELDDCWAPVQDPGPFGATAVSGPQIWPVTSMVPSDARRTVPWIHPLPSYSDDPAATT